ncbi:MAG: TldD/PmbA family protein [Firmicutes bacterium]|nr:TldD/PmbA family protein [Bacillota bacterium]
MKAKFSAYLDGIAQTLKDVVRELSGHYDYVSVLSTDSNGLRLAISQRQKSVSNETMATERGTVVRVRKDGLYSEYAFNEINGKSGEELSALIKTELDKQLAVIKKTQTEIFDTAILADEELELFVEKETELLPEDADIKDLVDMFTAISDKGMSLAEGALECAVNGQSTHVSKMFISPNRFLRQSYVYSEASVVVITSRDGDNKIAHSGISGLCGPELFNSLGDLVSDVAKKATEMLDAEKIVPGEYDIIASPEVSGLIAHEAFGHGVEMDMFVKGRALGAEHIGKRVGSDLVTMHEGALCEESVAAYAFDDEGVLAGDVTEIENGILKTGICDALAALRLGTEPTGNGKRENFAHKVYTRMTNTIFDSGKDTLEDMIASIDYGYLLEGMESGMEDPKHWGIQCIISRGYEIKDGKLTGKLVSPIVMTGYVPDLLGSISMASTDREVPGNGGCGKGHKEWVKVADGGPYLKCRARLG